MKSIHQNLYKQIVDNMAEGVNLVTVDELRIVYTNSKFNKMFGYEDGELIGEHISILNYGKTKQEPIGVSRKINKEVKQKGELILKLENVKKDGTPFTCRAHICEFDSPEFGNVYISIHEDITEREQAKENLVVTSQRYQTLFRESPVPLWEEDFSQVYEYLEELKEKGVQDFKAYFDKHPSQIGVFAQKVKILDVNKATLELYKANSKEDFLDNLNKIFTEKSYESFKKELITLAAGQSEFEIESEVKTLTGETLYVLLRLIIESRDKKSARALLATTDITERKAIEQERERFIKDLQKAFAEIKTLKGILPICSFCKKIRNDQGYWEQVDTYIQENTDADFSHGLCPGCMKKHYPEIPDE